MEDNDSCMNVIDIVKVLSGEMRKWMESGEIAELRKKSCTCCFTKAFALASAYVMTSLVNETAKTAVDATFDKATERVGWLEDMLAYATNLLSQVYDQAGNDMVATTGPADDPDHYDISGLLKAVREKYPSF